MPDDTLFPVVIIGGGLAGLAAAVHLAGQGITPVVLEASSAWVGGRLCGGDADTFTHAGRVWSFPPDHGVHALWGGYVNMSTMLARFTDVELQESQGEEWINRWGLNVKHAEAGSAVRARWIPAPFHYLQLLLRPRFWSAITPLDFISLPGFLVSILWTTGFDPLREQSPLEGLTMNEYFRGWTRNLRATFTGLGANLLAAPPDKISVAAFISALRFYTMLNRDSWHMRFLKGNSHDHLIQPLMDRITADGGRVMLGVTAQRIERGAHGWRVVVEDDARRGLRALNAEHVILAVNAPAARRLLDASPELAAEGDALKIPPALRTVAVRLWFSQQPREGAASGMFTGDFQVDNFFWLHRLFESEFGAWREAGGSAIEVHVYGSEKFLDQPDKSLLILAVNEVTRAFPELKGTFVSGAVRRNSRTHTQLAIPMRESLHVKTPWANIHACGDWVGYPTPSLWMERSVTTGMAAANAVLSALGHTPYEIQSPPKAGIVAALIGGLVRVLRGLFLPIFWLLRFVRRRLR